LVLGIVSGHEKAKALKRQALDGCSWRQSSSGDNGNPV
jgi:hypothetical protein